MRLFLLIQLYYGVVLLANIFIAVGGLITHAVSKLEDKLRTDIKDLSDKVDKLNERLDTLNRPVSWRR